MTFFCKRNICDCCAASDIHKVLEEGENRLLKEMDVLTYIKGMRTVRVLTSDKLARMNDQVIMSDFNIIEKG